MLKCRSNSLTPIPLAVIICTAHILMASRERIFFRLAPINTSHSTRSPTHPEIHNSRQRVVQRTRRLLPLHRLSHSRNSLRRTRRRCCCRRRRSSRHHHPPSSRRCCPSRCCRRRLGLRHRLRNSIVLSPGCLRVCICVLRLALVRVWISVPRRRGIIWCCIRRRGRPRSRCCSRSGASGGCR